MARRRAPSQEVAGGGQAEVGEFNRISPYGESQRDSPKAPKGTIAYDIAVVGLAFEREKGRSFTFNACHLHRSLAEEGYRRFLLNGVVWSAGVDLPREGASVVLDPATLGR